MGKGFLVSVLGFRERGGQAASSGVKRRQAFQNKKIFERHQTSRTAIRFRCAMARLAQSKVRAGLAISRTQSHHFFQPVCVNGWKSDRGSNRVKLGQTNLVQNGVLQVVENEANPNPVKASQGKSRVGGGPLSISGSLNR
jgi:hypothetical protein